MFHVPRVNVIESSDGFSVEVLGRAGLKYVENDHVMMIYSEVVATEGIAIWKRTIVKWEPPYEAEVIDSQRRDTILNNIKKAFEFRGTRIQVV
jgi:hypothetical protein